LATQGDRQPTGTLDAVTVANPSPPEPRPAKLEPVYQLITYTGLVEEGRHDRLWDVTWANQFNRTIWKEAALTTLQIKELVDAGRHVRLPELEPVTYDGAAKLPVDAYVMGILLAEGSLETEGVSFASADPEIVDRIRENLPSGHKITSIGVKHRITVGLLGRANKDANLILKAVRDLGLVGHLSWEKFVPNEYKFASVEDRLGLLRGYLDGDGSIRRTATSACRLPRSGSPMTFRRSSARLAATAK
jgi:ATP-dependent DNA helicase RecG